MSTAQQRIPTDIAAFRELTARCRPEKVYEDPEHRALYRNWCDGNLPQEVPASARRFPPSLRSTRRQVSVSIPGLFGWARLSMQLSTQCSIATGSKSRVLRHLANTTGPTLGLTLGLERPPLSGRRGRSSPSGSAETPAVFSGVGPHSDNGQSHLLLRRYPMALVERDPEGERKPPGAKVGSDTHQCAPSRR